MDDAAGTAAMPDSVAGWRDPRRVRWDGCWNTRHLGRCSADGGHLTRDFALIWSGNLARLTAAGRAAVLASGISRIIDVRSTSELMIEANPFATSRTPNAPDYRHLPLMDEGDADGIDRVNAAPSVLHMYEVMLDRFKASIGQIMTAITDAPPGGVVIHCHAGKDRTGLVVALALRLAGVSDQEIAEDYALSDVYLTELYAEMLDRQSDPEARARLAAQLASRPETMWGVLNLVAERGGIEVYLRSCGLSADSQERLKERLLMPAGSSPD